VQPIDEAELKKCPAKHSKGTHTKDEKLLEERASFGPPLELLKAAEDVQSSFLAPSKKKAEAAKAKRHRNAFVCAAGCSAREPQLEESMGPWADWRSNSTGLDMIDSLVGFCHARRDSDDPFIISVLWQGDVYLKTCQAEKLSNVGLYLIGPEDLSLVLVFLFGAQKVAQLPPGPVAFGMYLSDYTSLVDHHQVGPGVPMFAYLGRQTSWAIPWPSSFTMVSTQDVESWEQKNTGKAAQKPWDQRKSKAYWIGTVTGPWEFALHDGIMAVPRMNLLKTAKQHPEELEVEWSGTAGYGISWVNSDDNVSGFLSHGSQSIQDMTGVQRAKWKAASDWDNFKYFVNLDGVVLGGRLNKLLSLGGVVLQHQAGYKEHFEALLKPYEHYVPVEYDLSDLVEKVQWLQRNDAEAKRIAENGQKLASQRMRFEDSACYIWRALEALGAKTAAAEVDKKEVREKLGSFVKVSVQKGGLRPTLESFWGEKLEDVHTGNRKMSSRGIELLEWAWSRMEGLYDEVKEQM
jgi:hypothetical protein